MKLTVVSVAVMVTTFAPIIVVLLAVPIKLAIQMAYENLTVPMKRGVTIELILNLLTRDPSTKHLGGKDH